LESIFDPTTKKSFELAIEFISQVQQSKPIEVSQMSQDGPQSLFWF
jgi:hypothetical protein